MRPLHKFFRLTSQDRFLLLYAAIVITGIRLGLWLLPFQMVRSLLAKFFLASPNPFRYCIAIERVVWSVDVISRHIPGDVKCLARALATQGLLAQQGHTAQLQIGIIKREGKLEAHAWLENQGKVVIGNLPNLSDFTTLPALGMKP